MRCDHHSTATSSSQATGSTAAGQSYRGQGQSSMRDDITLSSMSTTRTGKPANARRDPAVRGPSDRVHRRRLDRRHRDRLNWWNRTVDRPASRRPVPRRYPASTWAIAAWPSWHCGNRPKPPSGTFTDRASSLRIRVPVGPPPSTTSNSAEPYGWSFGDPVAAGMHANLHAFCMTTAAASGRRIVVVVESPRGAIVSKGVRHEQPTYLCGRGAVCG